MIKLLFKYLIPLALVLTGFLVGYNYFFGTAEEQQQSKLIVSKIKDLGSEVFNLLHTEKEKYDAGKFDDALNKIGSSISFLKEQAVNAADGGQALLDQLRQLDQQKAEIQSQIANLNASSDPNARMMQASGVTVESLGAQLEQLAEQTERIGLQFGQR